MKEIEFIIDSNGKISIDQMNFKGPECARFSEEMAKSLGSVSKSTDKSEYFQSSVNIKPKVPLGG
jgi:hypothetical protein